MRRRPTDRIGLVVFGREAYTYVPLTLDHGTLLRMLGELRLGIIDGNGTAIGNGLGVALNRLCGEELRDCAASKVEAQRPRRPSRRRRQTRPDGTPRSQVIILLTDGDNNAGNISPEDAARWRSAGGQDLHDPGRRQRQRGVGRAPGAAATPSTRSCSSRSPR